MSAVKLITPCEKCNNEFELYYLGPEFPEEMREKILCIDCLFTEDCGRGSRRYRCSDMSCKKCFLGSFASCEKSRWWDYQRNKVAPREVAKGRDKKYWFNCQKCRHGFESSPNSITNMRSWCPYCGGKDLCDKEIDCTFCFNRSFASHEKAKFWDFDKNKVTPREVPKGRDKKYWFNCKKCIHGFESSPNNITNGRKWCPYCAGQKLCDKEIDCTFCFNRSFASHEKAKFWDFDKNKVTPREVPKGRDKKYWFNCKKCRYGFKSSPNNITNGRRWCPKCKNKSERLFSEFLTASGYPHDHQACYDWCRNPKTGKKLPFDFCLEELKIIIEVDGPQHFRQISNWADHKETQERDRYKEECALERGYTIIRIYQPLILSSSTDWKDSIKQSLVLHDKPHIITIAEDGVYDEVL